MVCPSPILSRSWPPSPISLDSARTTKRYFTCTQRDGPLPIPQCAVARNWNFKSTLCNRGSSACSRRCKSVESQNLRLSVSMSCHNVASMKDKQLCAMDFPRTLGRDNEFPSGICRQKMNLPLPGPFFIAAFLLFRVAHQFASQKTIAGGSPDRVSGHGPRTFLLLALIGLVGLLCGHISYAPEPHFSKVTPQAAIGVMSDAAVPRSLTRFDRTFGLDI